LDIGTIAVGVVPPVVPFSEGGKEGAKAVGFVPPAFGVYLEATDFVHLGAIYKATVDLEWDRRGLGVVADERLKLGIGPVHWLRINQHPLYTNVYKAPGNEMDGWRHHMEGLRDPIFNRPAKLLLFDNTTHARPKPPNAPPGTQTSGLHFGRLHRGWQDWETFSLEAAISEPFLLHTGVYVRAGFDISQVFDFALGIIGLDLYSDNAYTFSGDLRFPDAGGTN
jgi:hypothetical protein